MAADAVQTVGDILAAHRRLADAGLASDEPRAVSIAGFQTLADLLTVLTFQTGNSLDPADRVVSATCRATLSAVSDALAVAAGAPADGTETIKLLTAAIREARGT